MTLPIQLNQSSQTVCIVMQVDHIFIFSNQQGLEAEELVKFGLVEGSGNVHQGQGTSNRRFFFENFYLEIVWVSDEKEFNNADVKAIELAHRASPPRNGYSPFGLGFTGFEEVDNQFEERIQYRPSYLSNGAYFSILPNTKHPDLPWTFGLIDMPKASDASEPKSHNPSLQKLTRVRFGVPSLDYHNTYTNAISQHSNVVFERMEEQVLILEFDEMRNNREMNFFSLPLVIAY